MRSALPYVLPALTLVILFYLQRRWLDARVDAHVDKYFYSIEKRLTLISAANADNMRTAGKRIGAVDRAVQDLKAAIATLAATTQRGFDNVSADMQQAVTDGETLAVSVGVDVGTIRDMLEAHAKRLHALESPGAQQTSQRKPTRGNGRKAH